MFHRINSRADEERLLLEQKLALQSSIRAKRERQRRKRTHDTDIYTKMLEPVTKSIDKLAPPPTTIPATTAATAATAAAVVKQEPVKKEEDDDDDDEYDDDEIADEPEPVMVVKMEEPGELYQEALTLVPSKFREDGQLGLCPVTHRIGVYTYAVHGNTLRVVSNHRDDDVDDADIKQFEIRDLDLWKLLLVLNPTRIDLRLTADDDDGRAVGKAGRRKKKKYLPFVHSYVDIARELDLLGTYTGSKTRVKYGLLTHHWGSGIGSGSGTGTGSGSGSGFLYTSIPPPQPSSPAHTPRVVVLPPDNRGLMSELYRAVAELRAGNTSMRNLVVPMVREARRRHIHIPDDLLEPYEDTWVLA